MKRKFITALLLSLASPFASQAQWNHNFAQTAISGTGNDFAYDVDCNVSNESLIVGRQFSTTSSSNDIFLSTIAEAGNTLQIDVFGGSNNEYATGVVFDGNSNEAYIIGQFDGTFTAGTTTLTSSGLNDVFIMKYDYMNGVQWLKSIGGTLDDIPTDVTIDNLGNIYVSGYFEGTVDFDPGIGTSAHTTNGQADGFVLKLDPMGNYLYSKTFGSPQNDYCATVATDNNGNVFLGGRYWGTMDFDPGLGVTNYTSAGGWDIFTIKLTSSGTFDFGFRIGSTGDEYVNEFAFDGTDILATGYFEGTVDFDASGNVDNLTAGPSGRSAFVWKFSPLFAHHWAHEFANGSDSEGTAIQVNSLGEVLAGGTFSGTIDFDPGTGTNNLTAGNESYFLHLNSAGNFIYAGQIGGATGTNRLRGIGTSPNTDYVALAGNFDTTGDYDVTSGSSTLSTSGQNDGFITTLNACFPNSITPDVASLSDFTGECSGTPTAPTATNQCGRTITGTPNVTLPVIAQGTTLVTWTFDDNRGNVITQNQNVILTDITSPTPDVANLPDLTAECSITPTPPTATDNCSGLINATTSAIFPISTLGNTTVTWTYTDATGNSTAQQQTIILNDITAPIPDLANLPSMYGCGQVSLSGVSATDNCAGSILGVPDVGPFITTPGATTVTWSYDDGQGNIATQTQEVFIGDTIAPTPDVANLPDITSECSAAPTAPTASDFCAGTITGAPDILFPITTPGTTVVTWSFTDGPNTTTQTQNVIINDVTAPVPDSGTLADITSSCSVTEPTYTATDNCDGVIVAVPDVPFPITSTGTTNVLWTYTDANGNASTQTQNVIITPLAASTSIVGITLTASPSGLSYQWIDCDNGNAAISGETSETFTAPVNGNYAVIVTQGSCSDTSSCVLIDEVGLADLANHSIRITPNPSTGIYKVQNLDVDGSLSYSIMSGSGQLVMKGVLHTTENTIDLTDKEPGLYFMFTPNNTYKLIKQ